MSIIGLLGIIAILFVVIIVLAAFAVITLPVSMPYFKAAFSKDKYLLMIIRGNGSVMLEPAKFRNSRAIVSNGLAKFLKQGLHGSYTLGSVRMDMCHSEVGVMIEDSTLATFAALDSIGISDIGDLLTRVNRSCLIRLGLIDKKELTPTELENVKLAREYYLNNVSLLAPAVRELNVHDMVKNCVIQPSALASDLEEQTALIAKQYSSMVQGKKVTGGGGGIDMKVVMIVAIILVIGGLAVCFFMN